MAKRQSRKDKTPPAPASGSSEVRHEAVAHGPSEPVEAPVQRDIVASDEETLRGSDVTVGPAQFLTFFLGGAEYAVGILRIREIFELDTLTPVPTTPGWVRGVMNLRGSVVPVVDLAVKFGLGETPITTRTCVVIVEVDLDGEPCVMGALVEAVSRVVELSPDDIEPPPAFGTAVRVDCLEGMGKVEEKLLPILDVDHVLSADELLTAIKTPSLVEGAEVSAPGGENVNAGEAST